MRTSLFCHFDEVSAALDLAELRRRGLSALTVNVLYHDWVCFAALSNAAPIRRELGGASAVPVRNDHPPALRPPERAVSLALLDKAADAGLETDAWTVSLHRDDLARRLEPGAPISAELQRLLVTDAFGTAAPTSICPSSDEAAAYLASHASDIAATGQFYRFVVEGCHYPLLQHGGAHERDLSHLHPPLRRLLEICFCSACMDRMAAEGIDASEWRADVRAAVLGRSSALIGDARFATATELRRRRVTELYAAIAAAAPDLEILCADQPVIGGSTFRTGKLPDVNPVETRAAVGLDLAALAALGVKIVCLAYLSAVSDVVTFVESYLELDIPPGRLCVALRPGAPDCNSADDLIAKASAVRELGIDDLAFYELTQLDASGLENALRAAEAMAA